MSALTCLAVATLAFGLPDDPPPGESKRTGQLWLSGFNGASSSTGGTGMYFSHTTAELDGLETPLGQPIAVLDMSRTEIGYWGKTFFGEFSIGEFAEIDYFGIGLGVHGSGKVTTTAFYDWELHGAAMASGTSEEEDGNELGFTEITARLGFGSYLAGGKLRPIVGVRGSQFEGDLNSFDNSFDFEGTLISPYVGMAFHSGGVEWRFEARAGDMEGIMISIGGRK